MRLPVDNTQRLAALNPQRSVCVTAPAGSGKTELLSQRVLKLLATADQPEEILAITFTRKAAAEMHHRIIQALHFAENHAMPEHYHKRLSWQLAKEVLRQDHQRGWHLLDNSNRLNIQTIDGLCASLTRQMPILSNFGAQPQISDNPQQTYQIAVHNFLQQLEQDSSIAADLVQLLGHVDNDMAKVERLLIALLQRRDQWLLHIGLGEEAEATRHKLEQTLQHIILDVLVQLNDELLALAPELLPLLDYAGCNINWQQGESTIGQLAGIIELPGIDSAVMSQWLAIAELLLTKTNGWRKTVDKRTGFPTETQDGNKALAKELKAKFIAILKSLNGNDVVLQLLLELRHLPSPQFDPQQWQLLKSLTRLLPSLVAQLTLVFQQQGEVDYSQISMAALQALGDALNPTELAMKLDHQLRHILVDEFQDTASTQFRLLERLIEGWAEHNVNNPQRPNTLFIVGDGMQSIYGFREANVGLFLEARKQGINGVMLEDLPLTVNFRSDPTVVDWTNQTFSQAFPLLENLSRGAVPFEYAQAFNPSAQHSEVTVFGFSGSDARLLEADKTVELVQQLQQQNPEASIAILVRSRGHLRDIIPALAKAGLRWNATDIDPLSSYSPIIDLLTLTKALCNTADRVSWTALLRTPWLGLNNSDLYFLIAAKHKQSIWVSMTDNQLLEKLTKHGRQRLVIVRTILSAAFKQRQRLTVRCWIEGVWLALGGASVVNSRNEFDFIDDYFDLLETHQQGGAITSITEFEQAVSKLYAAPATEPCSVQVMTIHKAKGLEFDAVILPAMARAPRSDDKSLLMWREYLPSEGGDPGLVLSPLAASSSSDDKIYQHLRFEQSQATSLENTRLFYVAATRAINTLYILLTVEQDDKTGAPKDPAKNSLIHSAWSALEDNTQWFSLTQTGTVQFVLDFEAAQQGDELTRVQTQWQPPLWTFNNPLETFYLTADYDSKDNIPELNADHLPRTVGIVTHWIFEHLIEVGIDYWQCMACTARQQWLESLLHYHALPSTLWPQAINAIQTAINNTLADHKGRWMLSNQYSQSSSELSLLSCFGNKVNHKVIDRSFIDDKGILWIIDYKTSMPQQDESKEAFIEREITLYYGQLLDYKLHLSKKMENVNLTNKSIRTALYFTCYPHWQELD
ncbi:MAG: UvrD-helicase domain-containing protein [Pseudomonadales bacterium]